VSGEASVWRIVVETGGLRLARLLRLTVAWLRLEQVCHAPAFIVRKRQGVEDQLNALVALERGSNAGPKRLPVAP
jgi:hypothetical protein